MLAFGLLCAVVISGAVTDWKTGKIYNWLTLPAMLGGLVFWFVAGRIDGSGAAMGLAHSALALATGLVPMAVLFVAGGIGGGDVKLMGVVGALSADWRCVLATVIYAFLVGAVMAVWIMVRRRIVRRTVSRILGTALSAVALVKPDLPADSPRVPFGAALAVGGIVAGAEYLLKLDLPWSMWSP